MNKIIIINDSCIIAIITVPTLLIIKINLVLLPLLLQLGIKRGYTHLEQSSLSSCSSDHAHWQLEEEREEVEGELMMCSSLRLQ